MRRTFFFFVAIFISVPFVFSQNGFVTKKNLQPDWLIHTGSELIAYNPATSTNTIYFRIPAMLFRGDYVFVQSSVPFSVFMNGTLVSDDISFCRLSIDSLHSASLSDDLMLAIHQPKGINPGLETRILSWTVLPTEDSALIQRSYNGFTDFVIVGALLLIGLLIVIIRMNPKLSADYFSLNRVFMLRESDDNQLYNRIGNSTNILFYFFVSFLLGYYGLLIVQRLPDNFLLQAFESKTFYGWMFSWLILSLIALTSFFIKMLLIIFFSILFRINDQAGFHFFNFVRTLLLVFGLFTITAVCFLLWAGVDAVPGDWFYGIIKYALLGWVVLSFVKLTGRVNHFAIHLFSYICATEIIPFLIIIKVLYK